LRASWTLPIASYAADEVKEIRDKARAMEVYARQALNMEAERRANAIRLRAERKCGQLLKETEKAKGAPGNQYTGPVESSDRSIPTLRDMGILHPAPRMAAAQM
jgi:hypothetical protein